MCDPLSYMVHKKVVEPMLNPRAPDMPAQPDPALERANAEASAANAANIKTVGDKRAQRANVLALGGNGDQLGAGSATTVLGGGAGPAMGFQPVKRGASAA